MGMRSNQNTPISKEQLLQQVLSKNGNIFFDTFEAELVANGSIKSIITNQDIDSFIITQMVGYAEKADGTITKAFKVSFKDSGKNYNWQQKAFHGSALGSGDFPTVFKVPYILKGSSSMECDISNLSSTVGIKVFITVIGYKVKL